MSSHCPMYRELSSYLPLLFAALVKYRKSMKHKRAISPKHRHRIIGSNVRLEWRNILIIIGTPLRTPIASSRCSASWGSAQETERGKKTSAVFRAASWLPKRLDEAMTPKSFRYLTKSRYHMIVTWHCRSSGQWPKIDTASDWLISNLAIAVEHLLTNSILESVCT